MFLKAGFQILGDPWRIDIGYWTREIQKARGNAEEANTALIAKFDGVYEVEYVMRKQLQ